MYWLSTLDNYHLIMTYRRWLSFMIQVSYDKVANKVPLDGEPKRTKPLSCSMWSRLLMVVRANAANIVIGIISAWDNNGIILILCFYWVNFTAHAQLCSHCKFTVAYNSPKICLFIFCSVSSVFGFAPLSSVSMYMLLMQLAYPFLLLVLMVGPQVIDYIPHPGFAHRKPDPPNGWRPEADEKEQSAAVQLVMLAKLITLSLYSWQGWKIMLVIVLILLIVSVFCWLYQMFLTDSSFFFL